MNVNFLAWMRRIASANGVMIFADYLQIAEIRQIISADRRVPVIALTATATRKWRMILWSIWSLILPASLFHL